MRECIPKNPIINKIFKLFLQVVLIFIFLTVFFFTYVGNVEKESFTTQMNIVVDDIVPDINIHEFVPPGQEDTAVFILDGSMEVARNNALNDSKEEDKYINDQNIAIRNKAFILLGIVLGILLLVSLILYLTKHCIPFQIHIQDALIVVIFVAITEMLFLTIITKNYWSVDPGQVRSQIGKSIQKWIKENHPQ